MGRKPNTELRRQQIIDALLVEMASVGFDRASTKSIAERAGLAPGLVHYHFKSKEEILLVLVDQLMASADVRHQQLLGTARSPMEQLQAFVSARVGLGAEEHSEQARAWINIMSEAMGQPTIRQRVGQWLGDSHATLKALFSELGSRDADEQAALLMAMILGAFSLQALSVDGVPTGYAERQIRGWLVSIEVATPDSATSDARTLPARG